MRDKIYYDDFTGFTFNGKHCSQFGLIRISDGNRYEDSLVLGLTNEAAEVPGGVGQYYFGEQIKERTFSIKVAYDSVTEVEKREIRQWLHPDDKLHELIFDEKPYVKYFVKCSKEIVAKELCFNEDGKRIYKGETSIEFTAFMPYGVNRWKYLPDKLLSAGEEYGNIEEWAEASKMMTKKDYTSKHNVDIFDGNRNIQVYNPGDRAAGFVLEIDKEARSTMTINYTREELGSANDYLPVSESEFNSTIFNNGKGRIFVPEVRQLNTYSVDNITVQKIDNVEQTDNGYIEFVNGYAMFVSENTGKKYSVYYEKQGTYIFYKCNSQTQLNSFKEYTEYYGYIGGQAVNFYRKDQYFIPFTDTGVDLFDTHSYFTAVDPTGVDVIGQEAKMEIYLIRNDNVLNHVFLSVPDGSNINPKDWTEAQKMLYSKCKLRLDSNKKLVQYAPWNNITKQYDNWIGITGIVKEGDFFEIPVRYDKAPDVIRVNPGELALYVDDFGKINSGIISYNYLYI